MTAVDDWIEELKAGRYSSLPQNLISDVDTVIAALLLLQTGGGAPVNLPISDETVLLSATPSSINFAGAGVVASAVGNAVTITISGGSGQTVPKFSATQNAVQPFVSGAATKILFQVETFDTNGNFVPGVSPGSRFTASIAGYYEFNGTARVASGSSNITDSSLSFYVNGVEIVRVSSVKCPAVAAIAASGSALLFLNIGDYVELWGNAIGTSPQFDFSGSAGAQCFFSGNYVGTGNN